MKRYPLQSASLRRLENELKGLALQIQHKTQENEALGPTILALEGESSEGYQSLQDRVDGDFEYDDAGDEALDKAIKRQKTLETEIPLLQKSYQEKYAEYHHLCFLLKNRQQLKKPYDIITHAKVDMFAAQSEWGIRSIAEVARHRIISLGGFHSAIDKHLAAINAYEIVALFRKKKITIQNASESLHALSTKHFLDNYFYNDCLEEISRLKRGERLDSKGDTTDTVTTLDQKEDGTSHHWRTQLNDNGVMIVERSSTPTERLRLSATPVGESSGHPTYKVEYTDTGSSIVHTYFVKTNKHKEAPVLSVQEVVAGVFWNLGLPEYTSKSALTFNHEGKISGIISKSVPDGKKLPEDIKFEDKTTDFFSLAGVHVYGHVHCEDDGHRKNFRVVSKNGKNYYYRYDFDMSFQQLTEGPQGEIAGVAANRRSGRNPFEDLNAVTARDCISNPILHDAGFHFKPGQSRALVAEDGPNGKDKLATLAVTLHLANSSKGFGIAALTEEHKKLAKNPEYIKWKWYHYMRFVLMPEAVIRSEIERSIASIRSPIEREEANRLVAHMIEADRNRRQQFRQELLRIPEFVTALSENRTLYLGQMAEDNAQYMKLYGKNSPFPDTEKLYDEFRKESQKNVLTDFIKKNPRVCAVIKGVIVGTAGFFIARALLPPHIVSAISAVGIPGVHAILHSTAAHLTVAASSVGAAFAFFQRKKEPPRDEIHDTVQAHFDPIMAKIRGVVAEYVHSCPKTTLKEIADEKSDSKFLERVTDFISVNAKPKSAEGDTLANALKTSFSIDGASTEILINQLGQLKEIAEEAKREQAQPSATPSICSP